MADPMDVTNADDVTITILGDSTNKAGGADGKLVVDSFEWAERGDGELKSGVGNRYPIGASFGNINYEFSLTLEGDDADLMEELRPADDGKPAAVQINITTPNYKWVVPTAWCLERTYSGSDGDATTYDASGIAMRPEPEPRA